MRTELQNGNGGVRATSFIEANKEVYGRTTKIIRDMEKFLYEEKLNRQRLFILSAMVGHRGL